MKFTGLSETQLKDLAMREPQWALQQRRYGESQQPIIIIDNFSSHANELIKDSQAQTFRTYGPNYPGVQAHAPADYLAPLQETLGQLLSQAFDYHDTEAAMEMCMYSYITTPADALTPVQRYPHYDGGNPRKVALLHYLCGESNGGTQFYRHNRTGFETLFPELEAEYTKARHADTEEFGLRKSAYFTDTEHGFTRLEQIPARFNRAILYSSSTLHSGEIGPSPQFAKTPGAGRLTVNTFFVPAKNDRGAE